MKMVSISQMKAQLSAFLKEVEGGETILIVNRDRPVARLERAGGVAPESGDDRLQRLQRLGLVTAPAKAPDATLVERPLKRARKGAGLLQAVLDEREESS